MESDLVLYKVNENVNIDFRNSARFSFKWRSLSHTHEQKNTMFFL